MRVPINGATLEVEVLGPEGAPLVIAHHGGGGIGSMAEPRSTLARWPTGSGCSCSTPGGAAAARGCAVLARPVGG